MTPESEHAPLIEIRCDAVAGKVLASQLETGGLRVQRHLASEVGPLIAVVAEPDLAPWRHLFDDTIALEDVRSRRLGEDDWEDLAESPNGLVLIDLTREVVGPTDAPGLPGQARLTVLDAPEGRPGRIAHPEDVCLSLELVWDAVATVKHSLVLLTGEHLDEFSAHASIATNQHRTSLVVSIPMIRLIEASVAIADIGYRLTTHPGISSFLPKSSVTQARTFQSRIERLAQIDRYGPGWLNITAVGAGREMRRVDALIRNATVAASMINEANRCSRWTVAHFSAFAAVAE